MTQPRSKKKPSRDEKRQKRLEHNKYVSTIKAHAANTIKSIKNSAFEKVKQRFAENDAVAMASQPQRKEKLSRTQKRKQSLIKKNATAAMASNGTSEGSASHNKDSVMCDACQNKFNQEKMIVFQTEDVKLCSFCANAKNKIYDIDKNEYYTPTQVLELFKNYKKLGKPVSASNNLLFMDFHNVVDLFTPDEYNNAVAFKSNPCIISYVGLKSETRISAAKDIKKYNADYRFLCFVKDSKPKFGTKGGLAAVLNDLPGFEGNLMLVDDDRRKNGAGFEASGNKFTLVPYHIKKDGKGKGIVSDDDKEELKAGILETIRDHYN
jgi:hypothetical protein